MPKPSSLHQTPHCGCSCSLCPLLLYQKQSIPLKQRADGGMKDQNKTTKVRTKVRTVYVFEGKSYEDNTIRTFEGNNVTFDLHINKIFLYTFVRR